MGGKHDSMTTGGATSTRARGATFPVIPKAGFARRFHRALLGFGQTFSHFSFQRLSHFGKETFVVAQNFS